MQRISLVLIALFLILALPGSAGAERHVRTAHIVNNSHFDGVNIDLEDGSIIMTHGEYDDEEVEITENYELFINGRRIPLDADQQKLVQEYYDLFMEIVEYAKEIGWEGAKIGVGGAKLGLKAIGGLLKVVFTSYDTEDFERDMEMAAEKLEDRAEVLEKKAAVVEDMAHDLENMTYDLCDEIPQLEELGWF